MPTKSGPAAIGLTTLVFACAGLTGCGTLPAYEAAKEYREWQSKQVADQLSKCLQDAESPAKASDGTLAKPHDCFLTLVDSSTRRLDTAGRVPGSPLPNEPDVSKPASIEFYPALALDGTRSADEVVSQVAWMAMLTKLVYRRHLDESIRNLPEKACTAEGHPLLRLNATASGDGLAYGPSGTLASGSQLGRWELWFRAGADGKPVGCLSEGGLFYETFAYRAGPAEPKPGSITHAVIVFRGTEDYGDQILPDWATSLGPAMNRTPAQFKAIKREFVRLIEELSREGPGGKAPQIYSAGHSLGGGLAQFAAYLDGRVTAAYAFNTSPVTGWTWLQQLKMADPSAEFVQDPQVVRVSQDDEALSLVRIFTNAANTTVRRSGRTDVIFDFPSSRSVVAAAKPKWSFQSGTELHSITLLACNLAARVAQYPTGGAFGFRPEMAALAVAEKDDSHTYGGKKVEGLCQVRVKGQTCTVDWMRDKNTCTAG